MSTRWRIRLRPVLPLAIVVLTLAVQHPAALAPAPPDLRAILEGTWQLDEWHLNGEVLKPPQADARWSNHDGVALFLIHRETGGTAESTMGYGVYEMDAENWSYRYTHMQTTIGPPGGPAKITVTKPPPQMRTFKIERSGSKVILRGAGGDHREYEGPYFTFFQKGQIVRRWRKIQ
jgi:hypothetical protein